MAAIVHGWCGYVEKSNDVVFSQMVLNKLWIPDVLIDIIKDYIYISAADVLRKFYRAHLNRSITNMWVNYTPQTDIYGRDRQIVYAIGHVYGGGNIQIQGTVCVTCGDFDHMHNNMNGCCPQLFDLEDEPIHLVDNYWEGGHQETDGETDTETDTESEVAEPEIPEFNWVIDIPVANQQANDFRQIVLDNWNQAAEDGFQQAIADALRNPEISYTPTEEEEEVIRQQAENALWGRQPENYDYDEDIETQMADQAEYMREVEMEAYSDRYGR
jgi:hypothetical protein